MNTIVPRWEWRAFGDASARGRRFAALEPERVHESEELTCSRGGRRRHGQGPRRADGRQAPRARRRRRARAVAPGDEGRLPAAGGGRPRRVRGAPTAERPRSSGRSTRSTSFSTSSCGHMPAACRRRAQAPAPLHDRRLRDRVDGRPYRPGVDSDDRGRVRGSLRRDRGTARARAGVASQHQLSRGASRRSSGSARARFAVIDVGTNSVKFHVGERGATASGARSSTAPRSRGSARAAMQTGALRPEPMARRSTRSRPWPRRRGRTASRRSPPSARPGCASRPTRGASSTPCGQRCGVEIEVISGEEEARLAYLAAMATLGLAGGPLVVFDTGGGSSQFTFGKEGEADERFSVPSAPSGLRSASVSTRRFPRSCSQRRERRRRRPRASRRPPGA